MDWEDRFKIQIEVLTDKITKDYRKLLSIEPHALSSLFERLCRLLDKHGEKEISEMLYYISELESKYGLDAVKTALKRELHLRERPVRKGGRPSVVKEYMSKIDAIINSHKNEMIIEVRIKSLLEEVKRKYSKATYYKIKKYAMERYRYAITTLLYSHRIR